MTVHLTSPTTAARPTASAVAPRRLPVLAAGVVELGLIAALYVGYSAGRTLADNDLGLATGHALRIARLEQLTHVHIEASWVSWLSEHLVLAVAASYWYSVAHYAVTGAVMLLLWWRRRAVYVRERRTLVLASVVALAVYITIPVAPPRLLAGYGDVLALTAPWGWWSSHASAPAGLGYLTNELAAMPSLHVGWAVWVALVVWRAVPRAWVRVLAVAYPLTTSMVVIATGNHWVLDVLAGAGLMLLADLVVMRLAPRVQAALLARIGSHRESSASINR
ncbi:phosphatase PAP2 family protein [Nocardioides acrostichi]|uniref:Phosphatase PAP2 family protein n=1 Tax=Nocardioides acrostichi TaxID=2784339 RepID=A0A930Y749_9ACTN|nr:phosphatase PAP2 family protein [Nocardioides acrostichi]MBF4163055.1 phosphatase PAP2 family protein [Nocardioides acrostichi]